MEEQFYPRFCREEDKEEQFYVPHFTMEDNEQQVPMPDFVGEEHERTLSSEKVQGQVLGAPPVPEYPDSAYVQQGTIGYPCGTPVYQPDQRYQEQMALIQYRYNCGLFEACQKAALDIHKKKTEEEIKTEETAKREMNRADIASGKALQRMRVIIEANGGISVKKQQFGSDISGKMEFRISDCKRICCLDNNKSPVLYVRFLEKESISDMYLSIQRLDDRTVNRAFIKAGISFGFSHDKEKRCRLELVGEIMKIAPIICIPLSHGWYRDGNNIRYAYPEDMTWEEVDRHAR